MPDLTPAEIIRSAASLMRERAQAATPGPWAHMCLGSEGCQVLRANGTVRERGRGRVARFGQKDWKPDHADAEYVASMSPAVAVALADWLDREAALIDAQVFPQSDPAMEKYPLAVARAYLGSNDA
jgi:hypothetical protein